MGDGLSKPGLELYYLALKGGQPLLSDAQCDSIVAVR
jgi:hypothetical protein